MDQMVTEYDYYSDRIHPRCLAEFQSRVKHIYKEHHVTVICQIREHTVNRKTKLQLWLLQTNQQDWLNDPELKEMITDSLIANFEFCAVNY